MAADACLSSNPPTFGRVRAAARCLLLERQGAERDHDALGALALELLDALPEGVEDACWRKQRRDCDRLNRFLNEGPRAWPRSSSREPRRPTRSDSIGEVRRLRPPPTDPVRAIPLAVAFEALAGEGVPRSGMVRCPSADHEDRRPSCHVSADVFHCFGCGRGGSLIDLASLLWGIEPRGAGYREIRERLEAELLPTLRSAAA
jgi:hypothetical protein